ncbi:MAG: DUF4007 family protein [Anaerolineae bacterium]|nr:DUF4007 family protein [Anaerolineae bacterium]
MSKELSRQTELWSDPVEKEAQEIAPIPQAEDGTPPEEWFGSVHPDGKLELTRGFYLYADKFSRVLTYLIHERQTEEAVYGQLAKATGMSEPRVEAFGQYGVYMELLLPRSLRQTPLCDLVLGHDPFFDQPGTLWLLHYLFAANPQLVVWNYMCNAILPSVAEISKDEAADQFLPFIGRWSESSIRKKVRKELRAFFAGYANEMFVPLKYLREVGENVYAITRDVTLVPPLILLATALIYRDRLWPGSSGIEIPTLAYADHSPGRIMRQRELYLRQALDELHEAGYLTIESKANLDQVRFRTGRTWLDAVRAYYEERQRDQN